MKMSRNLIMILLILSFFCVNDIFAVTGNLIRNPGAEEGMAYWTGWGNFRHSWRDEYTGQRSGNYKFFGGNDTGGSGADQNVDVSQYSGAIDDGNVLFTFRIWIKGYPRQWDRGIGELFFRNSSGVQLAYYHTGWHDQNDFEQFILETAVPRNTRRIQVRMRAERENGSDCDAYFDDLSLVLSRIPELNQTAGTSLNFGNVYKERPTTAADYNQTAVDFNSRKTGTITFSNNGDPNSSLSWSVSANQSWIILPSVKSGSLSQNQSTSLTVGIKPVDVTGNLNGNITLTTSRRTVNIPVSAVSYRTGAAVTRSAPALGKNGRANVPRTKSVKFKIDSTNPTFPNATISKYMWKKDPGIAGFEQVNVIAASPNTSEKYLSFEDAGNYSVFCKYIDSNNVESDVLEIQVRSWDLPTVKDAPPVAFAPPAVSWYSGKYVGIKDQQVKVIGDANLNGNEEIAKYLWDSDNNWDTVEIEQSATAGPVGEFYQYPASLAPNIDTIWNYIRDNKVAAYLVKGFSRIDFPNTSGTFTSSNPYDTGLLDCFFTRFIGFINVSSAGNYSFHVSSDDGFRLRICGQTVAEFVGPRGVAETTGTYNFTSAGIYPIELTHFEGGGAAALTLQWTPPGGSKAIITSWNQAGAGVWNAPNLSGKLRCKAVTNYGIQSDEKLFDLKVYDALAAEAAGPYVGRPTRAVELIGSINKTSYPGASITYKWNVYNGTSYVPIDTTPDGKAKYTWTAEGTYKVRFDATVNTSEGLVLNGSDETEVSVQAGRPTAIPGGPYRGGIAGGNYTPVQFFGNPRDYVEADDIGKIQEWVWIFDRVDLTQTGAQASTETYTILDENVDSMIANLTEGAATTKKLVGDPNSGDAALEVGSANTQKFRTNMPGWASKIVQTPLAADEFRYITFAWRKNGGTGIMLQLNGNPGGWGHKYHAGTNVQNWTPSIQVSNAIPGQWELVTRDLFADWGAFTLTGIAFTSFDGVASFWDDVYLHKSAISPVTITNRLWNPTYEYPKAGMYQTSLRVQSEFTKWSYVAKTAVQIIDGKITGYVRAADLRTPVKDSTITLASSHVDKNVMMALAGANSAKLQVARDKDGNYAGISTTTDNTGFYSFEHIPLGSYRVFAFKKEGDTIHEYEKNPIATELTLDAPNQLAIDFVDLSVFPIGGRIYYSIQKNGSSVFVENVVVEAQTIGSINTIRSLPSNKALDAAGGNYSLPLFSGKYLFTPSREGHDVRIKTDTPGYDSITGLVTIDRARTDIDFIDYTSRKLTVYVIDSGGFKMSNKDVIISGENGQAQGKSDAVDGKFIGTLPPGIYTVRVPGAKPEEKEVNVTSGDDTVKMTIPVKIVITISPKPKLLDVSDEFLKQLGLTKDDNPVGYMYYYPPKPRTHIYTITATASGNPVEGFTIYIKDEVSMMTENLPTEQMLIVPDDKRDRKNEGEYTVTAGYPRVDRAVTPPLASPKKITFRATKEGYTDSDPVDEFVTILGEIPEGSAAKVISVPVVNYMVLHDPPGDDSHSYIEDSLITKGYITNMKVRIDDEEVPVYPSPWSTERSISGFDFTTDKELGEKGLLGYEEPNGVLTPFLVSSGIELATGAGLVAMSGPAAWAFRLIRYGITIANIITGDTVVGMGHFIQYEIRPDRSLKTPSGDSLPDLVGPGKGDIYFGEGWTIGLQTKYFLGIKKKADGSWGLLTTKNETYDILQRSNQYIYTVRDIENIIKDLDKIVNDPNATQAQKTSAEDNKQTWQGLLNRNPNYVWNKDYFSQGKTFDTFKSDHSEWFSDEDGETLIFSGGPTFEYSRNIKASDFSRFSLGTTVNSTSSMSSKTDVSGGFELWGVGLTWKFDLVGETAIVSDERYDREFESGEATEQTIGFVLHDDDIGDNIATRVFTDPIWGTPIFYQDAGSYTSDPWEPGTNKAVDVTLELLEDTSKTFDYHDGAHYKLKATYTGNRKLESQFQTVDFTVYSSPSDNKDNMTARFNGDMGPYIVGLNKDSMTANIALSLYPPEKDWANSASKEYEVTIVAQEKADLQITRLLKLKPKFADLRAPRAIVSAPYSGERVSPALFQAGNPFSIIVVSNDTDLKSIKLQIRAKQPNGVWEPWRDITGMVWTDGGANANVTVFDRLDRVPIIREFTFQWAGTEIRNLGVGEYAIRAIAADKATSPNVDINPPDVLFQVDDSKPSVLTSIPDYQARDKDRLYRGELSAIFTDDMRADDFSDRTFYVTDLLNGAQKVGGFVSYSPALRKAIFVPIQPFVPNGFYRAEIKTDVTKADNTIDRGVHDLAGNPLDNSFMWTFRTTDAPFEPIWTIILSAADGTNVDANNIAGVEYGAADGEEEKDARAVPALTNRLSLSFLNRAKVEFDRDLRPADGRLSHHWFFTIDDAKLNANVTIRWKPSIKLTRTDRQYQIIRLIEFDVNGNVTNTIPLDPTQAPIDPNTGEIGEFDAYTYANAGEATRYFRLDVMKADLVATLFQNGTSGWRFFSVPITPQRADPFVNLGDDLDPLQMFRYDTRTSGYKVYPLDIGEVSLQTARSYFTRLGADVEIDVGGSSNLTNYTYTLESAGWNAIGNPFILPVSVANLTFNGQGFAAAVASGLIEATLYRWKTNPAAPGDQYEALTNASQMAPWDGIWIKTRQANISITIPAPAGLANAVAPLPASFNPPLAPPQNPIAEGSQLDLQFELTGRDLSGKPFSSDVTTILGTREGARSGWDDSDQSEPPTLAQTVAAYFDHPDWGDDSGLYNTDYQPILAVGEQRTWKLTLYTKKPDVKMTLSWERLINLAPDDIILYIREDGKSDWQDMRSVRSIDLISHTQSTRAQFEIMAQRFRMSLPADVQAVAGEKKVTICWKADNNDFITGYRVTRQDGKEEVCFNLDQKPANPVSEFVDTDVAEDKTYTYQVSFIFRSGAELRSQLLTVRTLPVIKQTSLLQSYPNPFNPEVWIPYELAEQASVMIQVYNTSGQLVRTLDIGIQPRGRYISREKSAYWDGQTQAGERAASGVYFYVLKAGKFTAAKKMALLK